MFVPLYLGDPFGADAFETAMLGMQVLKALLGIGIAYIAYRGFRDNASRPMLYIAIGFVLVLGVPFLLLLVSTGLLAVVGLTQAAEAALVATSEISQILGLLAIVHALRL